MRPKNQRHVSELLAVRLVTKGGWTAVSHILFKNLAVTLQLDVWNLYKGCVTLVWAQVNVNVSANDREMAGHPLEVGEVKEPKMGEIMSKPRKALPKQLRVSAQQAAFLVYCSFLTRGYS